MPAERKTITFGFVAFWGGTFALLTALGGGFWKIHTARIADLKESFARNQKRIEETHAEALSSARRDYDNKLELLRAQTSAEQKIRNLEYTQALDGLRAELAAARGTLELKADSGYVSVNDLVINTADARRLLAGHTVKNVRRLLLPDYEEHGWMWNPDFSLVQVMALINKQELPLRPDDVKATDAGWWPIVNMFSKVSPDYEAYVGTFDFDAADVYETQKVILGNAELPKEITRLPIGMMGMSYAIGLLLDPDSAKEKMEFREFSAKSDAFYIKSGVTIGSKEYANEFLVMREGKTVVCAFAGVWSRNAVDPIRKEVSDWIKRIRIIRE